jgi:maltose alpha-D-glucosyltransferase/alpha-amylase
MAHRWYRNGIVYSLDICMFQDSDGDGVGDLAGLMSRLDYLSRLGVDVVWLNPFHPSPREDSGYDVTNHYDVDPRYGTLGDFAELLDQADERGIRIMLDLVLNHTSRRHPWFRSACSDPRSPYRDWYVWSDEEPDDLWTGAVFPGVQDQTWSYSSEAGRWYRHRFYHFQPDLNTDNPRVRDEFRKILVFWLRLGVAGFRVDAAPFLIESRAGGTPNRYDYTLLRRMRETVSWQRRDAVLLVEANVPDEQIREYFGEADDEASRAMMMFAFRLNQALMLALARQNAEPVRRTLAELPELPRQAQWATFLRNHDEVDLANLSAEERADVFREFGPEPEMQIYHRGIRRRLVTMLGGDRRRLELAYSLLFSLPGTPVIRYGDEIGMGDDLSLPERNAVRTAMQWTDTANGGFSSAEPGQLVTPVISDGRYSYKEVNVLAQRRDPLSLLTWFERMLHTRRECMEIGVGHHEVLDVDVPDVLVHQATSDRGTMLFVHNLGRQDRKVTVRLTGERHHRPLNVAADGEYDDNVDLLSLAVNGFGYRWIRLNHTPWD